MTKVKHKTRLTIAVAEDAPPHVLTTLLSASSPHLSPTDPAVLAVHDALDRHARAPQIAEDELSTLVNAHTGEPPETFDRLAELVAEFTSEIERVVSPPSSLDPDVSPSVLSAVELVGGWVVDALNAHSSGLSRLVEIIELGKAFNITNSDPEVLAALDRVVHNLNPALLSPPDRDHVLRLVSSLPLKPVPAAEVAYPNLATIRTSLGTSLVPDALDQVRAARGTREYSELFPALERVRELGLLPLMNSSEQELISGAQAELLALVRDRCLTASQEDGEETLETLVSRASSVGLQPTDQALVRVNGLLSAARVDAVVLGSLAPLSHTRESIPLASVVDQAAHTRECPICFDDGTEAQVVIGSMCGHAICITCVSSWIGSVLEMGTFPALCPVCVAESGDDVDVPARVSEHAIQVLAAHGRLGEDVWARFVREQRRVVGGAQFFKCPSPACDTYLLHRKAPQMGFRRGLGGLTTFAPRPGFCTQCSSVLCLLCHEVLSPMADGRVVHECQGDGDGGQEGGDDPTPVVDSATLETMQSLGRQCPCCRSYVERISGCDVMQCGVNSHSSVLEAVRAGGCGTLFNWSTGQPVEGVWFAVDGSKMTGFVTIEEQRKALAVVQGESISPPRSGA